MACAVFIIVIVCGALMLFSKACSSERQPAIQTEAWQKPGHWEEAKKPGGR